MQSFNVAGMTCGHCVRAVTEAIKGVDAGAAVEVNLASGRVVVRDETVSPDTVAKAITDEGYTAEKVAA